MLFVLRLETSPTKSLSDGLAEETSVSKTSARRATKFLPLRPCKASVVHAFKVKAKHPSLDLTLSPLTWKIWWAPNNASRWQIGFTSACKGLTISMKELESKHCRPHSSRVCSVRRATLSASAVALGVFVSLSKGYYHGVSISRFIPQPLKFPRIGVRRNADGQTGGHLSVKQEQTPQIQKARKAVLAVQNIR